MLCVSESVSRGVRRCLNTASGQHKGSQGGHVDGELSLCCQLTALKSSYRSYSVSTYTSCSRTDGG